MDPNIPRLLQEVPTPLLDVVRLVCQNDQDKVLLVQETDDPNWKLPGGKIHQGETVFQATKREIKEELGVTLDKQKIFNVVKAHIPDSDNYRYIICNTLGDIDFQPNADVARAEYFDLDNLPKTKFARHIKSAVELSQSA